MPTRVVARYAPIGLAVGKDIDYLALNCIRNCVILTRFSKSRNALGKDTLRGDDDNAGWFVHSLYESMILACVILGRDTVPFHL